MASRPAAGGGRWVDVAPERLSKWLATFAERHGGHTEHVPLSAPDPTDEDRTDPDRTDPDRTDPDRTDGEAPGSPSFDVRLTAADGSVVQLCRPPGAAPSHGLDAFVAEATRPRRLGLLLARQSAVAVGIAEGAELVTSKVDTSYVQGRTAAGGWSQHRFARRRENQAKAAAGTAADIAVRLLLPATPASGLAQSARDADVAAIVTGGDRRAIEAILTGPRLAPLRSCVSDRFLDVPEPRHAVLSQAIAAARAIHVLIRDP